MKKLEDGTVETTYYETPQEVEEIREEEGSEGVTTELVRQGTRNPEIKIVGRKEYDTVSKILLLAGIEARYKLVKGGFLIFTRGAEDYRKVQECMRKDGITGHWYQHNAKRQLRTIIKGIPDEVSTGEVKNQLEEQEFTIGTVTRMRKDNSYDMVTVTTENTEKGRELLKIRQLGGVVCRTEFKRKPEAPLQCYNCQEFGHVQYRCTAKQACAFCAGSYASRDCPKGRGKCIEAKCARCGGNHPVFFKSCPQHPLQVRIQDKVREAEVRAGCFSEAAGGSCTQVGSPALEAKKTSDEQLDARMEAMLVRLLPAMLDRLYARQQQQ